MKSIKKHVSIMIILSLLFYLAEVAILSITINNITIAIIISTGLTPFNVLVIDWLYHKAKKDAMYIKNKLINR